jgi:acyl-CoA thioester hydrolase
VPAQWSSPVRYVECDQQGVVFNAHYLTWADETSNHWWASHGLPWDVVAQRCEPVVKASSLEWSSSARWGDTVTVDAETERLGTTSVTVRYTIRVDDRVCCVVRNTYVAIADTVARRHPSAARRSLSHGHQPAFS